MSTAGEIPQNIRCLIFNNAFTIENLIILSSTVAFVWFERATVIETEASEIQRENFRLL